IAESIMTAGSPAPHLCACRGPKPSPAQPELTRTISNGSFTTSTRISLRRTTWRPKIRPSLKSCREYSIRRQKSTTCILWTPPSPSARTYPSARASLEAGACSPIIRERFVFPRVLRLTQRTDHSPSLLTLKYLTPELTESSSRKAGDLEVG